MGKSEAPRDGGKVCLGVQKLRHAVGGEIHEASCAHRLCRGLMQAFGRAVPLWLPGPSW